MYSIPKHRCLALFLRLNWKFDDTLPVRRDFPFTVQFSVGAAAFKLTVTTSHRLQINTSVFTGTPGDYLTTLSTFEWLNGGRSVKVCSQNQLLRIRLHK